MPVSMHLMFHLCNDQCAVSHWSANAPDVVVVNEESREVSVLEIVCTFDTSLEEAFMTKVLKYQPLVNPISELGYRCALLVFCIWQPRTCPQVDCQRTMTAWDVQRGS